jgi:hypothetical protein
MKRAFDKQQARSRDHGIVRTPRGEDQPKDKERAQRVAGLRAQKEAAERRPQSPGQPARGE